MDIQRATGDTDREYFAMCFYNSSGNTDCKGRIEVINEFKGLIVFNRIYVSSMYGDSTFFDGKEDRVWISRKGFEKYKVGESISFYT